MNMTAEMMPALSESVQMYLVAIERESPGDKPVPLSRLSKLLQVSTASVNEMCRKLQDEALLVYRPYKGATLTPNGRVRARKILRRHRLWEVFLVNHLQFAYQEAHEIACQLEHSTPNRLSDRLDEFLGQPSVNPNGEPIPSGDATMPERDLTTLDEMSAGQWGHVIKCDADQPTMTFLLEQGIGPGAQVSMLASAVSQVLVKTRTDAVSLARPLAQLVHVDIQDTDVSEEGTQGQAEPMPCVSAKGIRKESSIMLQNSKVQQTPLIMLKVGQTGTVVKLGIKGPIRRRLMDMGLTPGCEVSVLRVAPLGDPVEFSVRGYSLSLRQSEAARVLVELDSEED